MEEKICIDLSQPRKMFINGKEIEQLIGFNFATNSGSASTLTIQLMVNDYKDGKFYFGDQKQPL